MGSSIDYPKKVNKTALIFKETMFRPDKTGLDHLIDLRSKKKQNSVKKFPLPLNKYLFFSGDGKLVMRVENEFEVCYTTELCC